MSLPNLNQDIATQVVSWAIALLVIGAIIYFCPGIAVGIIIGWMAADNKDKIQAWIDKHSESGPETP